MAKKNTGKKLEKRVADAYRKMLCQAYVHNFLAELALDGENTTAGDRTTAADHARTARERAMCDGPPHCYRPALDRAETMLDTLGTAPTDHDDNG